MAINGHDCIEQLKGLPVVKQPQIIFVDLEMPELNGIQTILIAKPLYSHIHFIVLTVFDDDEKIFQAIQSGASGYLLKDENAIGLRNAITAVSDIDRLPRQREIEIERRTFAGTALHPDFPGVLLNNAVGH